MKAEKIVLLDTLTVLEQIEIKQCLMDKYTVIMADEVSNGDLTGVNFIITTHEIKDSEEKQYIIPFYPGHGVKGVIDFCQQLYYLEHRSVIKEVAIFVVDFEDVCGEDNACALSGVACFLWA